MSTAPTPATPSTSKLQTILTIIQLALVGLKSVPITAGPAALAGAFLSIFQNATTLYEAESGQPFDVTKIPIEQPVP